MIGDKKVIFVNSHPIQYFTPLYKFMNENGLKTEAWYCSDESLGTRKDKEFGVAIKWDIPLLEGYEAKFFKNNSWKPSHFNGFFGLINLSMVRSLFKEQKSVVVVHGWHYFTHFLILLIGSLKGHTICVRSDNPLKQEVLKKGLKKRIKFLLYKWILFPRITKFLYVGEQNRLYYKSYGIADDRLLFCPYAVDNERFQKSSRTLSARREDLYFRLGIPPEEKVIVFSGKYIDKKKPLDLIEAYIKLARKDCWLVMVGEGELREPMERLIQAHQLTKVILTGFVNQMQISEYYFLADVFVMCSAIGENWGLSVNEAMNFNAPLIVSDLTGCAEDLVLEGANGYVIKTGDTEELKERIEDILYRKTLSHNPDSLHIVSSYSFERIMNNLKELVLVSKRDENDILV